jgi:ABC-2 type transport system permease protein
VPSPSATARPAIGLIVASLLRADFTVLIRSVRTLVLNILLPIFIVFITNQHADKGSAGSVLVSAVFGIGLALTYGLMSSSLIGYSLAVARDREAGIFERLRVTPAPTWAIMGSRLLVQIVLDIIMTVLVLVTGGILHHLAFNAGAVLLILAVSISGGAMFLAIAQALVGLVRSAAVVNAFGRILYVAFLLLGLLGSSGILGTTVQAIANWTPVGAMINIFGGVLDLSNWNGADTTGLIATAAYIVIGTFVGIRWFRWDAR